MNRSVEKIVALLEAGGYPWPGGAAAARICRTRAGRLQLAAGAWKWFLWPVDDAAGIFPSVGSQWTVAEIVKGPSAVSWNKHTRSVELDVEPTR